MTKTEISGDAVTEILADRARSVAIALFKCVVKAHSSEKLDDFYAMAHCTVSRPIAASTLGVSDREMISDRLENALAARFPPLMAQDVQIGVRVINRLLDGARATIGDAIQLRFVNLEKSGNEVEFSDENVRELGYHIRFANSVVPRFLDEVNRKYSFCWSRADTAAESREAAVLLSIWDSFRRDYEGGQQG